MRIVYQSFGGRYSDNPRVLFEALRDRPDIEHVWLGDQGHRAGFPDDVEVVDIAGPDARATLESADLLIANTHTEVDWDKPSTTTYLQTWHGTPLKRIHRDVLWAPPGRLDRLDHDVARWDLLLSPNPASTPRFRQAFGYDGEVLEHGYPRNDLLSSPDAAAVRTRVRDALGLDEASRVVLYTPTWRDDETFADGAPAIALPLDLGLFAETLGESHDLLVRAHYMVTARAEIAAHDGVHDVSWWPDVSELYAAADVLVTDYSSTMFDFAVTGRPIVLLAHDLERFEGTVRGFYFDLVSQAPGPLVRTSEELVEVLGRLDAEVARHADQYARFRSTFTSLEDGHATDRVLARLGL
ncbi:CDP-glycerol glycerophosphotransferase family protein [Nocardioides plantarum]|uniref:CDP-glycerol glycerophosphotransferase family protein n=1 Tax=Nocardioides plantarum TaxID=29299 RepID=A0ABV5KHD8_9ACTN|nr:CDP-glycerol glycerophosphotransferase family protein [Nocardioides plantarum]